VVDMSFEIMEKSLRDLIEEEMNKTADDRIYEQLSILKDNEFGFWAPKMSNLEAVRFLKLVSEMDSSYKSKTRSGYDAGDGFKVFEAFLFESLTHLDVDRANRVVDYVRTLYSLLFLRMHKGDSEADAIIAAYDVETSTAQNSNPVIERQSLNFNQNEYEDFIRIEARGLLAVGRVSELKSLFRSATMKAELAAELLGLADLMNSSDGQLFLRSMIPVGFPAKKLSIGAINPNPQTSQEWVDLLNHLDSDLLPPEIARLLIVRWTSRIEELLLIKRTPRVARENSLIDEGLFRLSLNESLPAIIRKFAARSVSIQNLRDHIPELPAVWDKGYKVTDLPDESKVPMKPLDSSKLDTYIRRADALVKDRKFQKIMASVEAGTQFVKVRTFEMLLPLVQLLERIDTVSYSEKTPVEVRLQLDIFADQVELALRRSIDFHWNRIVSGKAGEARISWRILRHLQNHSLALDYLLSKMSEAVPNFQTKARAQSTLREFALFGKKVIFLNPPKHLEKFNAVSIRLEIEAQMIVMKENLKMWRSLGEVEINHEIDELVTGSGSDRAHLKFSKDQAYRFIQAVSSVAFTEEGLALPADAAVWLRNADEDTERKVLDFLRFKIKYFEFIYRHARSSAGGKIALVLDHYWD